MARSYFPQNTGSVWFWNLNLSVLLLLERRILQVHVSVDCALDDLIRQVWCSLSMTEFCFSVEFIYLQWLKPKTGPGHDNSSLQTLCSSVVTNYSMWMCNKVWWSPCWFQMVASWYMCFLGFSCLKLAHFVCFGNWLYWMLSVFTPDLYSFLWFVELSCIFFRHFLPSTESPTQSPIHFLTILSSSVQIILTIINTNAINKIGFGFKMIRHAKIEIVWIHFSPPSTVKCILLYAFGFYFYSLGFPL